MDGQTKPKKKRKKSSLAKSLSSSRNQTRNNNNASIIDAIVAKEASKERKTSKKSMLKSLKNAGKAFVYDISQRLPRRFVATGGLSRHGRRVVIVLSARKKGATRLLDNNQRISNLQVDSMAPLVWTSKIVVNDGLKSEAEGHSCFAEDQFTAGNEWVAASSEHHDEANKLMKSNDRNNTTNVISSKQITQLKDEYFSYVDSTASKATFLFSDIDSRPEAMFLQQLVNSNSFQSIIDRNPLLQKMQSQGTIGISMKSDLPDIALPSNVDTTYANTVQAINSWCTTMQINISHDRVASLDCEFDDISVCVIQLCYENTFGRTVCGVLHISSLETLPSKLVEVLSDTSISICGLAVKGDLTRIGALSTPVMSRRQSANSSIIDLAQLAKNEGGINNAKAMSLSRLVMIYLEKHMPKGDDSEQCSNWRLARLDSSQILYAALDAYAGLVLHGKIISATSVQNTEYLRREEESRRMHGPPNTDTVYIHVKDMPDDVPRSIADMLLYSEIKAGRTRNHSDRLSLAQVSNAEYLKSLWIVTGGVSNVMIEQYTLLELEKQNLQGEFFGLLESHLERILLAIADMITTGNFPGSNVQVNSVAKGDISNYLSPVSTRIDQSKGWDAVRFALLPIDENTRIMNYLEVPQSNASHIDNKVYKYSEYEALLEGVAKHGINYEEIAKEPHFAGNRDWQSLRRKLKSYCEKIGVEVPQFNDGGKFLFHDTMGLNLPLGPHWKLWIPQRFEFDTVFSQKGYDDVEIEY